MARDRGTWLVGSKWNWFADNFCPASAHRLVQCQPSWVLVCHHTSTWQTCKQRLHWRSKLLLTPKLGAMTANNKYTNMPPDSRSPALSDTHPPARRRGPSWQFLRHNLGSFLVLSSRPLPQIRSYQEHASSSPFMTTGFRMNGADIMDVLQMCSRPPPALMLGEKVCKIESEIDLH